MWRQGVIFGLIISIVCSIYIPLTGKQSRCMIVYSVGQAETVKLDINFPQIQNQQGYQFYEISWKNTESDQKSAETVKNGRYRRQLNLTPNIIYDLCLRVQSSRDIGIIYVQYTASNIFSVNQAEVKVPNNMLKSEDITEAYLKAQKISNILMSFQVMQQNRTATHAQIFRKTNLISTRLIQISICELIIIIIAGAWQFWAVWGYLKKKSYV